MTSDSIGPGVYTQFLKRPLVNCFVCVFGGLDELSVDLSHSIRTTKYTILTFLPKNLFEQFHRVANMYFLFIVILNFIPAVNAFSKETSMIPLLFVLTVTAVKVSVWRSLCFNDGACELHLRLFVKRSFSFIVSDGRSWQCASIVVVSVRMHTKTSAAGAWTHKSTTDSAWC